MLEIKESNGQFLIVDKTGLTHDLKAVAYDLDTAQLFLKAEQTASLITDLRFLLDNYNTTTREKTNVKYTTPERDSISKGGRRFSTV